ncbi:hypothetical protein [Microbacterium sp. HJ5]
MLSLVTAAEQQYRHETWSRDREQALLVAIRSRAAAQTVAVQAAAVPQAGAVSRPSVAFAPRLQRAAWARPIGARARAAEACATACAVA